MLAAIIASRQDDAEPLLRDTLTANLDIDGLAYVKGTDDELLQTQGATAPVPLPLLTDVVDSARECPGECIHVRRVADRVEVYGPDAE